MSVPPPVETTNGGLEGKPPSHSFSPEISKMNSSVDSGDQVNADDDIYARANAPQPGFTKNDQQDMYRMGKIQQFRRNYSPWSTFSFTVIVTSVWEYLLLDNDLGLIDGGLAGIFWSYVWTFIGYSFVVLSIAEMASMAPISGGMYHWVSEFAPPRYQKLLSYLIGCVSTISWQVENASTLFFTGSIIQALAVANHPNTYNPQNYQGTLLAFAMALIAYIANIWGASWWPKIQNGLVVAHIIGFLAVIIVLWVAGPNQSAKAVFTEFTNEGGWSTIGLSIMVGQISASYAFLGTDSTVHIAEEVQDASRYVPISIFWNYIGNGLIALVLLITFLFSIDSIDNALADPTGYPFIYVFRQAVSTAGVNGLTSIIIILITVATISWNALTARQTFAFARDNGLPFSRWIGHVDPKKNIPANAIALSCTVTVLLSLINLGSPTAMNAICNVATSAIMMTYMVSIACVLYRRLAHPELLPRGRWSLGKWGVPVNVLGLIYVTFTFFWSLWPWTTPYTADSFNWSVVVLGGVIVLSLVMYVFHGRFVYKGPVTDVKVAKL